MFFEAVATNLKTNVSGWRQHFYCLLNQTKMKSRKGPCRPLKIHIILFRILIGMTQSIV